MAQPNPPPPPPTGQVLHCAQRHPRFTHRTAEGPNLRSRICLLMAPSSLASPPSAQREEAVASLTETVMQADDRVRGQQRARVLPVCRKSTASARRLRSAKAPPPSSASHTSGTGARRSCTQSRSVACHTCCAFPSHDQLGVPKAPQERDREGVHQKAHSRVLYIVDAAPRQYCGDCRPCPGREPALVRGNGVLSWW